MDQFKSIIMGDMNGWVFWAYFFIASFAALFMLVSRAEKKRTTAENTPSNFSWGFFFRDNILKFIINIMAICLGIRFSNEFLGQEITGWLSAVIGLSSNFIAVKLQELESKARG